MRETPSGGVGSIQDQGVNYIQLNIQPPIPLLNTELRNATLNKDYERSTLLDRAQLTAQPGQPWPRRPRMGGAAARAAGGGGRGRVWEKSQPLDGSLAFRAPFLSSAARTQGRSWGPPLCPAWFSHHPPPPHDRPEKGRLEFRASVSWSPAAAGRGLAPSPRLSRLFPRPCCARKSCDGAPSSRPQAMDPSLLLHEGGWAAVWAQGASWALGSHFPSLRAEDTAGKGAPEGWPRWSSLVPWCAQARVGMFWPGLPSHCCPAFCPPLPGAPPTGGWTELPAQGPPRPAVPSEVSMQGEGRRWGAGHMGPRPLLSSSSFAASGAGLAFPKVSPHQPLAPVSLAAVHSALPSSAFLSPDRPPQEGSGPLPRVGVAVMKNQSS